MKEDIRKRLCSHCYVAYMTAFLNKFTSNDRIQLSVLKKDYKVSVKCAGIDKPCKNYSRYRIRAVLETVT